MSKLPPHERVLVARLRLNDPAAQEEFVAQYEPVLMGFLRTVLRLGHEDSEDITSEVLYRFLDDPGQFDLRRGTCLGTWLLSVGRNRAIDAIRKRRRRPMEVPLPHDLSEPAEDDVPGSPRNRIMCRLIRQAYRELPREHRDMIRWWAKHMSHAAIAKWTDKSNGAVRQVISRTRRRMYARIEEMSRDLPPDQRELVAEFFE